MNKEKVITVSAGHSNVDSGAVAKDGTKEATLAVKFRNAVVSYLQQDKNIHVKTDGHGTNNAPLSEAIKLIAGSDVAVEFHMNASTNATAYGVETISLTKDKILAQQISLHVAEVFGSKLRGDNGWIDMSQSARGKLGFVSKGGLIVELGFISNEKELKAFNDKYWLAAKAVAEILIDYVNSKK